MENSTVTGLLQRMNDEMSILLIPVFIYIGLLMFTGIIGNTFVCYFYGCKTKGSPTTCFIVVLAVFDLMSCTISMPMEIVDMRFFYLFPDATACKALRTINFFCTISSGIILVAIAIERYRKICLPFKKQMTLLQAKLICILSALIAFVFSWPCFVFFSVVSVDVPISELEVIQARDCTTVKEENLRVYLLTYTVIQFLLFIISCIAIIVLYILIYKQLIKVKQIRRKCTKSQDKYSGQMYSHGITLITPSTSVMHSNESDMEQYTPKEMEQYSHKKMEQLTDEKKINNETLELKSKYTHVGQDKPLCIYDNTLSVESEEKANSVSCQAKNCDSLEIREGNEVIDNRLFNTNTSLSTEHHGLRFVSLLTQRTSKRKHSDKYTTITFLIAVIFIVSFLPYLCLSGWQSFSKDYLINRMSDVQIVFFQMGIRSYFLNSVLNSFIYGFFNQKFREFIGSVVFSFFGPNSKRRTDV